MTPLTAAIAVDLEHIRAQSPIILNLTNDVAMDLTANALLAIGASPVMSTSLEEIDELVAIAGSVVINLGTLDAAFLERASAAVWTASRLGKPVVLDPVGAGATKLRTSAARDLFESGFVTVMRANASETLAVLGERQQTRGVESSLSSRAVDTTVREFSRGHACVLAVSGTEDFVFDRGHAAEIRGGDFLMTKVTAMGCTATTLVAAFLSVNPSAFSSAVHAMAVMADCGSHAKRTASAPGSFRSAFLDALWRLESSDFASVEVRYS